MSIIIDGAQYRLRTSSPIPTSGGDYILQTFMAEKNIIKAYLITETLPGSDQFRGQGGSDDFISANFSRLPDMSGNKFSGTAIVGPEYIDEDSIQGSFY